MTYLVFQPDSEQAQEQIVQQVYLWEQDLHSHKTTLARYQELLADPKFIGREFPDGTTFRNKIEKEILVLEWAIKECEKLVETEASKLPKQEKISEIVAKFTNTQAVLPPQK